MVHLGEVAAEFDALTRAGLAVVAVAQAAPPQVRRFLAETPLPFPLVSDPTRAAYRAFGLGRVSWLHFFRPGELWRYTKLVARGAKVRRPFGGEDVLQLGGDFILDRERRIVFAYPSKTSTDRPAVSALLAAAAAQQ